MTISSNRQLTRKLRLVVTLVILCTCVGCDQATKQLATQRLRNAPAHSFLADCLRFEYALNPGGFLSLGSTLPDGVRTSAFILLNSGLLMALTVFLIMKRGLTLPLFVALAFILAGGIGNLIDRVWQNGLVTDFIVVGIGPLRTGVFNVADMAVTFGAIAVACLSLRQSSSSSGEPQSLEALSSDTRVEE